jgi:hypothetical protein
MLKVLKGCTFTSLLRNDSLVLLRPSNSTFFIIMSCEKAFPVRNSKIKKTGNLNIKEFVSLRVKL